MNSNTSWCGLLFCLLTLGSCTKVPEGRFLLESTVLSSQTGTRHERGDDHGGYSGHIAMEAMGDQLNVNPQLPVITTITGGIGLAAGTNVLFANWIECNLMYDTTGPMPCKIYVKKWDGHAWELLGDAVNSSEKSVSQPVITVDGDTPIVAYIASIFFGDTSSLVIKKWNGNQWVQMGNYYAPEESAQIKPAVVGSTLYISRILESDSSIEVSFWDGSSWTLQQRFSGNFRYPIVNSTGVTPLLSYLEYAKSNGEANLRVKSLNGNSWENMGDRLNDQPNESFNVIRLETITSSAGVPFAAWSICNEDQMRIKKWSGSSWENSATLLKSTSAVNPPIMAADQDPFISWQDYSQDGQMLDSIKIYQLTHGEWRKIVESRDSMTIWGGVIFKGRFVYIGIEDSTTSNPFPLFVKSLPLNGDE